jgi:large subunit ribosomal protein L32e
MKKAELMAWSKELGLDGEGTVEALRTRILEGLEKAPAEAAAPREEPAVEEKGEAPAEAEPESKEAEAEGEAEEPEREEGAHMPKAKPKLDAAVTRAMALRREIASRRPRFVRQEWFRYQRLGEKWRNPHGMHSKVHRHFGYRPNVPSIGYRGPKAARGLHPSGFREVLVHNLRELEAVDPKVEAARIAATVGTRKRLTLQAAAAELGIRILNRREEE